MSGIINIGDAFPSSALTPAAAVRRNLFSSPPTPILARSTDSDMVEISRFGVLLSDAIEPSTFSIARVHAIRAEIRAGAYETTERIDGTVERLLDVIA